MTAVATASQPPIRVIINGSAVVFDQPPIIENGRTLVPLRAIYEALGAEVEWTQVAAATLTMPTATDDEQRQRNTTYRPLCSRE